MSDTFLAVGEGLQSKHKDVIIVGAYNEDVSKDDVIIVGNGTSDSGRNTSFAIDKEGNISSTGTVASRQNITDESECKDMFICEDISSISNVWYCDPCSTEASVRPKVVVTESGDFEVAEGNIIVVTFTNTTTVYGYLDVDGSAGTGSGIIVRLKDSSQTSGYGPVNGTTRTWNANQEYIFVCSKTNPSTATTGTAWSFWEIDSIPEPENDVDYTALINSINTLGWEDDVLQ